MLYLTMQADDEPTDESAPARTAVLESHDIVPRDLALRNCPNPFNPHTHILISLPHSLVTTVEICDVLGKKVGALVQREFLCAGRHELAFNGSELPSGIYRCEVNVESQVSVSKMMLIR